MKFWTIKYDQDEHYTSHARAVQRLNVILRTHPYAYLLESAIDTSTAVDDNTVLFSSNAETMSVFVRVYANWEGFLQNKLPGEVIRSGTGLRRPTSPGAWMRIETYNQPGEEDEVQFLEGRVLETLHVSAQ